MTAVPLVSRRRCLVLAALLLGVLGVVVLPTAGHAVEGWTLQQPGPETTITGRFTIVVTVDAEDGELVEQVQAQIAGTSNRVYDLQPDGPPDLDGRQRWSIAVDPLGEDPLHNGPHRLVARPVSTGRQPPPFDGHEVTLAVPYRADLVAAPSGEDPMAVVLTWEAVELPDFESYAVERRSNREDGQWAMLAEFEDAETVTYTDQVETAGAYRYRLVVRRGDGDDGQVAGYSDPQGVRADPDNPGTFEPPPEPTPTPSPAPPPADSPDGGGVGDGQGGGGEDVAEGDPGPPETQTATTPGSVGSGNVRPPQTRPDPAPAPQAPAVVPLDDGVFEPLLPLEETQTEVTVLETENAFVDGSAQAGDTLAVLTEEPPDRNVVIAAAGGLLLLVSAAHVRRFLRDGDRV